MNNLGLLKENPGVSVVALTPDNVKALTHNYNVFVEKEAGILAGFSDEDYETAGAIIEIDRNTLVKKSDILITHSAKVNFYSQLNKVVISGYSVLDDHSYVLQFNSNPIDLFSLSLLPRTTKAQAMDILSSLAAVSGYQAVIAGFDKLNIIAPMVSSAGGTLYPAKVLVLGAGVAGLQAIATAKRLGAVVQAFDIRKQTKAEVESLGASFIEVEGAKEDATSGGYAIAQDEDFTYKVQSTIAKYAKEADLIITTARIPGTAAPRLILKETIFEMKRGSVIIDMASDSGGNCQGTVDNQSTIINGTTLIGDSTLYNHAARSASILLGNNMVSFIEYYLLHKDELSIDPILSATLVTRNGKIVNERLCAEINTI